MNNRRISRGVLRQGFLAVAVLWTLCLLSGVAAAGNGNIDPDNKYAWAENAGWLNFAPTNGAVTVYNGHLEGHLWGENIGWIRLGTHTGGGDHTYGNTSATDYGVNRNGENLSGYAWGENIGWINFNPTHGGVTIDMANGNFSGHAWSENVGWIKFAGTAGDDTAYNVKTEPNVYMVTTSLVANGNIEPSGVLPVNHGETIDFKVTPDPDYRISFVTGCDGNLLDNIYTTGSITGECSVRANFILNTFTLTVINGSGGGDYLADHIVTITANTPEPGHVFNAWTGDHAKLVADPSSAISTITMPAANIIVTAKYKALPTDGPPPDDEPGDNDIETPVDTEITHDSQIVDSGSTLANNADYDGVTVNKGGTVNNNESLSNLANHGTINGGTVSGSSSNSGVLNQVDIASGSILDNNGGTISGGENNGTVFGGSIKGFYENNGVLSGMAPDGTPDADHTLVIEPGAVATGGTLEGDIVNMGSLVDVTFGEDASILFLPWTNGEPGRLEGTISFIDASGLVFVIEIPSEAIFPDPDTIGEDGLMLNARNFLDYAWDHEWDIEVNMAAAPLNEEAIIAIPNGYFLVGGTVLSEKGSKSSAPVEVFVPFENWEIPEGYSSDELELLVYDYDQKQWDKVSSENTGDKTLKANTPFISAYAVVLETDERSYEDDGDAEGKKSSSSSTCFLNTLIPDR